MVLDAASLDAILQEARSCFLYEDAPDHLAILEQGVQRLLSSAADPKVNNLQGGLQGEYTALMRSAHSLKGGAGLAELPSLQKLSHKLEDLLQNLHEGRVPAKQTETAYELLVLGVEQVKDLLAEATSNQVTAVTTDIAPIVIALDGFLQDLLPETDNTQVADSEASTINPFILKAALEVDLEDCLQRLEQLLKPPVRLGTLKQGLNSLVEECTLLGQTLDLTWLLDSAESVRQELTQASPPLESIAKTAIAQMRQLRAETLNPTPIENQRGSGAAQSLSGGFLRSELSKGEEQRSKEISIVTEVIETELVTLTRTKEPIPAPVIEQVASAQNSQATPTLNLRMPVTRLDRMNNTLGELLISHERLSLYQSQLHQTSAALKKEAQRLNPINEQVRVFYDQLATPLVSSLGATTDDSLSFGTTKSEFDSLQFDQYTEFHTTLQDFQEVMVRVQETRADIDLITRDLQEALAEVRQQLDSLRGDLTESRLVPFKFLAERFVPLLQSLNQRYHKSVQLEIEGKDILVDQVILEQLQTPLTHLLRNAFDHGTETPAERLALGKPEAAQITLSANVQGNQVTIAIADDGRGIDPQKVYQKAVKMGLCHADAAKLTKDQILKFLFMPGFSTAAAVTDLSGRGVGLDVVRLQVERLRGSVRVETKLGQGTKFTITIPLTLSILPLLLCRCQQRTLAIPSISIREIIALSEFCNSSSQSDAIIWQNRRTPLFGLTQLLPYTQTDGVTSSSQLGQNLGVVLDVGGETVVVAVDALLRERELVLKPFDTTVKVPAYVAGCTVLGTGEVVPVISPHHLGELVAQRQHSEPSLSSDSGLPQTNLATDVEQEATILIVDDSVTVRRLLDRVLNQAGYHVVQCRDGKEAIDALDRSSERYDLVISDIEMPRLDGFGLLREIRSHSRWHHLPVAMLTSRENNQHRQKAKDLGATAYFTKPFHPAQLLSAIATLIK